MTLKVNLSDILMGPVEKRLDRLRCLAWGAFAFSVFIGLLSAGLADDAGYFGRSGSLGIVVGVIYARQRYILTKQAERKLEGVLRNPQAWITELSRQKMPDFPAIDAEDYSVFSEESVTNGVERIIADLDKRMFNDEAAIVIASTLIWGYGDTLLRLLRPFTGC